MSIPKIIHYCWFGGGVISPENRKCMESWKKYCPDYKIIEWNEQNFDISKKRYAQQAYEAKKYAFVSDYVRLAVSMVNSPKVMVSAASVGRGMVRFSTARTRATSSRGEKGFTT